MLRQFLNLKIRAFLKKIIFYFIVMVSLGYAQQDGHIVATDIRDIAQRGTESLATEYSKKFSQKTIAYANFIDETGHDLDVGLMNEVLQQDIKKETKIKLIKLTEAKKTDNATQPDLYLSGKVTQKSVSINEDLKKVDYTFWLTLKDTKTDTTVWKKSWQISRMIQRHANRNPNKFTKYHYVFQGGADNAKSKEKQQDFRHSRFLLSVEGGFRLHRESDKEKEFDDANLYVLRAKSGFMYRWNPSISLSLHGIYELWQDKVQSNNSLQKVITQEVGLGSMLQLGKIYFGGGATYGINHLNKDSFDKKYVHPYAEGGVMFLGKTVGINVGTRYVFAPNDTSYKNKGLAVFVGLMFAF